MDDLIELKKCLHIYTNSNNIDPEEECTKNILSEIEKKNVLQTLQLRDSNGLTPLLYSADRGNYNVSSIFFFIIVKIVFVCMLVCWFAWMYVCSDVFINVCFFKSLFACLF